MNAGLNEQQLFYIISRLIVSIIMWFQTEKKKNVRFIGEVFAYCKSPQIELPNAAGFDRILEIHQFPYEPLKSIVVHVS